MTSGAQRKKADYSTEFAGNVHLNIMNIVTLVIVS